MDIRIAKFLILKTLEQPEKTRFDFLISEQIKSNYNPIAFCRLLHEANEYWRNILDNEVNFIKSNIINKEDVDFSKIQLPIRDLTNSEFTGNLSYDDIVYIQYILLNLLKHYNKVNTGTRQAYNDRNEDEIKIEHTFDNIFSNDTEKDKTIKILLDCKIINTSNQFLLGNKKKAVIMAFIDVLRKKQIIPNLPDNTLAKIFSDKFNVGIKERTSTNAKETKIYKKYFTDFLPLV